MPSYSWCNKLRTTALIAAFLALAASGSGVTQLAAQDSPANMTIILDSSRSMWGQIDGVNKVVSARTVIGELAKNYENRLQLGLVAYGHRQSSGCQDVESILTPGAHKASEVADAVNSLKPKGSTPIAAALEQAAESAGYKEKRTSLLLLSDGLDNCSGDPCAIAEELGSQSDTLSIHVVVFDSKDQDALAKLSCISDATGGTFHAATNEGELAAAVTSITEQVLAPPVEQVAQLPAPGQVPYPQPGQSATAPAAPQPYPNPGQPASVSEQVQQQSQAKQPPEARKSALGDTASLAQPGAPVPVSFSARLVEGGDAVKSGIVWRVFDPRPDSEGKYKLVATHSKATPTDALPPGEYLVNAAYGLAHTTKRIQVQTGKSLQENFVLNAGGLRLGAALVNGGPIPPNSVRYDIYADEADQFGNRKKILDNAKPGLVIRLNAGAYYVVSRYGDANAVVRADVAVEPGRLTEATINHSAAKVTFKLVLQPGGEALADTRWNILTPRGDLVKESAGALPTHVLAAGNYSVLAKHQGKNYTRDFEVQPGEVTQIEVVIR